MIRSAVPVCLLLAVSVTLGCDRQVVTASAVGSAQSAQDALPGAITSHIPPTEASGARSFLGFDRNTYPGDAQLAELRKHFDFAGFWLNNPPGEKQNTWAGRRPQLLGAGFGFVVLFNGRLDTEIKHASVAPETLGGQDAQSAISAARHEGFPAGTVIFLDQEEGGRLLPEQSSYFFAFTQAVAASQYRAGSYLSGQPSSDGLGPDGRRATITTAQDVRETVAKMHYHPVMLWVAQDACPPAPGCTLSPAIVEHLQAKDSGIPDATVWQYAQSPRRAELTHACAATYDADGSCRSQLSQGLPLDLNIASSSDPSHGR